MLQTDSIASYLHSSGEQFVYRAYDQGAQGMIFSYFELQYNLPKQRRVVQHIRSVGALPGNCWMNATVYIEQHPGIVLKTVCGAVRQAGTPRGVPHRLWQQLAAPARRGGDLSLSTGGQRA